MSVLRDPRALALLVLALLQMGGDVLGIRAAKGLGAASMASPAPRVFSAVRGLETYSTRFFLEWTTVAGEERSVELTPELAARLRGPYNRRNVYGAALAYGPVLATDGRTRPLLDAVLDHALGGDAPLLAELGLDASGIAGAVRVRYEPVGGADLGDLPTTLTVGRPAAAPGEAP